MKKVYRTYRTHRTNKSIKVNKIYRNSKGELNMKNNIKNNMEKQDLNKRNLQLRQKELRLDLANGHVLKNCTNGYVFLRPFSKDTPKGISKDSNGDTNLSNLNNLNSQIKINAGKNRGNRPYRFSNPHLWVTLSFWKGLKIKALYYLGLKQFIK